MPTIPAKLQITLGERHRGLVEETMDVLELPKKEVILRAIEGLHKIAIMQRKKEKETAHQSLT